MNFENNEINSEKNREKKWYGKKPKLNKIVVLNCEKLK